MATNPHLKLWTFPAALYPRRVTIYLKERALSPPIPVIPTTTAPNGDLVAPGKPTGSVPILQTGPETYIYQSLAILEYLEDTYPPSPTESVRMRGTNPAEAARVRDLVALLDEATAFFVLAVQTASQLWESMGKTPSRETAAEAKVRIHALLDRVEVLADDDEGGRRPFLVEVNGGGGGGPTFADCVLLATVQYAREVYGVDLTRGHPRLARSVAAFELRESAAFDSVPEGFLEKGRVLSVGLEKLG